MNMADSSFLMITDMIAIPDFSAGAMENWGLITYRETAMLYEEGVSSEGNLQRVKVVIAHELAHQVNVMLLVNCSLSNFYYCQKLLQHICINSIEINVVIILSTYRLCYTLLEDS